MPTTDERLARLARPDKWYLSGGDGILWAPTFPVWLHRPGFWDEAHVFSHPYAPLFSLALVDATGREIPLVARERRWQPDRLVQEWRAQPPRGKPATLFEVRTVLPGGRFQSTWTGPRGFVPTWLVAFSTQPGPGTRKVAKHADGLRWTRTVLDRHDEPLDVRTTLGFPHRETSALGAVRSVDSADQPVWAFTPFPEQWAGADGPTQDVALQDLDDTGSVYFAVATPLPAGQDVTAEMVLRPRGQRPSSAPHSEGSDIWATEFSSQPVFECSDPFLERYYDYRVYGLRLNRLAGGWGHVEYPTVAEGIGSFHVPIAYSAPGHMLETRWRHDADLAQGVLRNFLACQRTDGAFHGRIYPTHLRGPDFYHANWGDAVRAVDTVHPDDVFLTEACHGLTAYAEWLRRTRDPEECGLFDVVDPFETGQEHMPRYQAVNPDADRSGGTDRVRLKGIDVTVYTYQLFRALAWMYERLGQPDQSQGWADHADVTGYALLDHMWHPEAAIFTDVHSETLEPTGVKCAVSFYPLLTDLLDAGQLRSLLGHLENDHEFATPYPVPSISADDPRFDACARWQGKRRVGPGNGRVWPMTNSHILEGLLRQWQAGHREVGAYAARFLRQFIHMMFFDGDVARPNCFAHYNPLTGHPSVYRGIDDYQHSWVNDLLIRGVTGVEARETHLLIDPLPLDIDRAAATDLRVRGHRVWVSRRGTEVEVDVDGRPYYGVVGTPMEIAW